LAIGYLQHLMKDRKGFSLSIITPLHNLVLCIWSTVMFVWMVLDIYAMIERVCARLNPTRLI
jgi:hypothetical protein